MKKLIYSQEDLDLILSLEIQEKEDEIERLNNDIKELLKENSNKEKVIIAQDNIIKEVREYIINNYLVEEVFDYVNDKVSVSDEKAHRELLEILDKENNNE